MRLGLLGIILCTSIFQNLCANVVRTEVQECRSYSLNRSIEETIPHYNQLNHFRGHSDFGICASISASFVHDYFQISKGYQDPNHFTSPTRVAAGLTAGMEAGNATNIESHWQENSLKFLQNNGTCHYSVTGTTRFLSHDQQLLGVMARAYRAGQSGGDLDTLVEEIVSGVFDDTSIQYFKGEPLSQANDAGVCLIPEDYISLNMNFLSINQRLRFKNAFTLESESEFIDSVLGIICEEFNKKPNDEFTINTRDFQSQIIGQSRRDNISAVIEEQLADGNPMVVTYDPSSLFSGVAGSNRTQHSEVIVGQRFNADKQRCEVKIRSSILRNGCSDQNLKADYECINENVWMDKDVLMDSTSRLTYINEQTEQSAN